jgi:hypothetical protein
VKMHHNAGSQARQNLHEHNRDVGIGKGPVRTVNK